MLSLIIITFLLPGFMGEKIDCSGGQPDCFSEYQPICAGDGTYKETFHNSCILLTYACDPGRPYKDFEFISDGPCTEEIPAPTNYDM